jgi:guanylate kinase
MGPRLLKRDEFEQILAVYHASNEAIDILQKTPFVGLAGLTAAGRNTLIEHLESTNQYRFVRSDTTRPPRLLHGEMEKNGGPYWFKTEDEVLRGLKNGEYLEAAIIHEQQVSGLSVREVKKAREAHKIAVTELTPEGIDTYSKLKPDMTCIFILPPSYDTWLTRLIRRGEMNESEVERRKRSAQLELEHLFATPAYKIIVNDDMQKTLQQARRIIENNTYTSAEHDYGIRVAQGIQAALKS